MKKKMTLEQAKKIILTAPYGAPISKTRYREAKEVYNNYLEGKGVE